ELAAFSDMKEMPRIKTKFNSDPSQIPFDFAEVLAAMVMRNVYVSAPANDPMFDVEGVKAAVAGALPVFQLRNQAASLRAAYPDAGRDFPEAVRNDMYGFLTGGAGGRAGRGRGAP